MDRATASSPRKSSYVGGGGTDRLIYSSVRLGNLRGREVRELATPCVKLSDLSRCWKSDALDLLQLALIDDAARECRVNIRSRIKSGKTRSPAKAIREIAFQLSRSVRLPSLGKAARRGQLRCVCDAIEMEFCNDRGRHIARMRIAAWELDDSMSWTEDIGPTRTCVTSWSEQCKEKNCGRQYRECMWYQGWSIECWNWTSSRT